MPCRCFGLDVIVTQLGSKCHPVLKLLVDQSKVAIQSPVLRAEMPTAATGGLPRAAGPGWVVWTGWGDRQLEGQSD